MTRSAGFWIALTASAAVLLALAGRAAEEDSVSSARASRPESTETAVEESTGARGAMGSAAIPFSHALHAGKLGMDCRFCHGQAMHQAMANLPAARDCYVCHWSIDAEKPAIVELERRVKAGEPIVWPAAVRLPAYVRFPHDPHVRKGIACAQCHGDVAKMEDVKPDKPLRMEFCVECHRTTGATRDCIACHH